jgi:hypothetical protein
MQISLAKKKMKVCSRWFFFLALIFGLLELSFLIWLHEIISISCSDHEFQRLIIIDLDQFNIFFFNIFLLKKLYQICHHLIILKIFHLIYFKFFISRNIYIF